MEKSRPWLKWSIIGVPIIAVLAVFTFSLMASTDITDYLTDGQSVTYGIKSIGLWLNVDITSMNGNMDVKVVVDGQTAIENNGINNFSFKHNTGLGYHTIQVIIENPTLLGLGATIQVSGVASLSLW